MSWRARPLSPGTCHAWFAERHDATEELLRVLDRHELDRLAALRRHADRDRFLVGAALARVALTTYLGGSPAAVRISRACASCGRPHGKPRLAARRVPPVEWSVTHSGDKVVVAVGLGHPLGVDVERLDRELPADELAPMVLSDHEMAVLAQLDPGRRVWGFYRYWTRKEAVLKAMGRGLTVPLRDVVVSGPEKPPRVLSDVGAWGPAMTLHDFDVGSSYVCSLAVAAPEVEVIPLDGTALLKRFISSPG